jgi:hypothetical protein
VAEVSEVYPRHEIGHKSVVTGGAVIGRDHQCRCIPYPVGEEEL